MLNIIRLKLKNKYKNIKIPVAKKKIFIVNHKEFIPAIRHWKNSIYIYNKKPLNLLPEANNLTIKLIKGYFNLYSLKLKLKERKRKFSKISKNYINNKKYTKNKIFVSEGEFKHTNDKINITIYFYNRQMSNYYFFMNKNKFKRKMYFLFKRKKHLFLKKYWNWKFKEKKYLKYKGKKYLRKYYKLEKSLKILQIVKIIRIIRKYKEKQNIIRKIIYSNIISKNIKLKLNKKLKEIQRQYEYEFFKKSNKKIIKLSLLYMYFRQLIYINKSKFNNIYLQDFINLIKKIYKKNIEFNFINIKYFYLNSNIFTQLLVSNLKKNRRKLRKYLKSILLKTKEKSLNLKQINFITEYKNKDVFLKRKARKIRKIMRKDLKRQRRYKYNNVIDYILKKIYLSKLEKKIILKKNYKKDKILKRIKYKKFSGIRLQLSGRLTKRYTASRSIKKIIQKGSINNINSLRGYRTTLLRGKFKSNLELTKINSKTRIGSFGVKGLISGI